MRAILAHLRRTAILLFVLFIVAGATSPVFAACTRTNPGLSVTPGQSGPGAAGRIESYQVTITSNDSADCAAGSFFLKSPSPAPAPQFDGWTLALVSSSFSLTPGQSATTTLQITSPPDAAIGTYNIGVSAFNFSNFSETDTTVGYVVSPTPQPDFSIGASSNSVTVHQGASGTATITTTGILGFSGSVVLSASGLANGVTAGFSPASISGSGNSTLTLTATNGASLGTFNATITGTSGALTHSTTVSVTIDLAPILSSIAVTPANASIGQGSAVQFHATGTYTNNTTADITNSVTWSSSDTNIASIGSGGLASAITNGNATITATLNAINGSTQLHVTNSAGCAHNQPDLVITPSQSPSGKAGRLENFSVTITNQDSLDCNNATFLLVAAPPAPPDGWTTALVTTAFSLAPGQSGSTNLQVRSPATLADGPYDVNVAVYNWPLFTFTNTKNATYNVNANPSDFSLLAAPGALTVARNSNGTVTISSSVTGTFSKDVSLSASGLPSGVTAGFSQTTLPAPGSGDSTLTFTADGTAQIGTFNILITGTAAGPVTRTTNVSLTITGVAATLQSISVTPANPSVFAGIAQQFQATGTYSDNSTQDVTSQVTWSSSDPTVATIGSNGLATTIAAGFTTIGATLNSVSGSTQLQVTATGGGCQTASPGIVITPTPSSAGPAGRLVTFTVTVTSRDTPECGIAEGAHSILLNVQNVPSPDWTAALVANSFQLLPGDSASTTLQVTSPAGLPDGNYDVIISATNLHVFKTNTAPATYVIGSSAQSDFAISVAPPSVSVQQGNTASVQVSSAVLGGFNQAVGLSISALPAGVTAAFNSAILGAPGSGNSTLTFTAANNATTGTVSLTVTGTSGAMTRTAPVSLTVTGTSSAVLQSLAVTPSNPSIFVGQTQQFQATGTYSDNSIQDLTSQVSWASGTLATASINANGLASGLAAGTSTITATLNAIAGGTLLTVSPPVSGCFHANPNLVVTPTQSPSGAAGRTEKYTVTITNQDTPDCAPAKFLVSAAPTTPTPPDGWTIGAVNPTLTLAPGATGTTELDVASPQNLDNGIWPLTVTAANWPVFTNISTAPISYVTAPDFALSASPGSLTILQGANGTVGVSILVSGGFNSTVAMSASGYGSGVTASFNPVSLSPPGSGNSTLTLSATLAATPGTYTVVITGTSGALTHSVPISLTVKLLPPTLVSISVTPVNSSALVGSTVQFHATGNYSNSTTQDLTSQVTWSSSNTSVATIGSGGMANAIAAGSTNISAALNSVTGTTGLNVSTVGGGGGGGGGGSTCTHANPAIVITPAISPSGPAGRIERFTVTVTNQDNAACGAATFLLTTNATPVPAGFSAILVATSMTLLPGQQSSTTLQVTSPAGQASGSYVITITALNNPEFTFRKSATATYVIN